jgi:hypothetical protein
LLGSRTEQGQEWDWLSDAFGRVQVLVTLFLIGGAGLVFWEMRNASPIVNFRPLREGNFALCALIIFLAFAVLYGSSTLLPALLESLFGYDAFHAAGHVAIRRFCDPDADSRWRIVGSQSRRTLADCRGLIDLGRRLFLDVAA